MEVLRKIAALPALFTVALAACGDSQTAAIRVGDVDVSEQELFDDLDEFASNPDFVQLETASSEVPDGYTSEFVTIAINDRVFRELNRAEFEARGLELTDEQRDEARTVLAGSPEESGDILGSFSDDFAERYVDDVARQVALQNELGDEGYNEWITNALAETEIEVSSRFGSWDPAAGRAVPPAAPEGSSEAPTEPEG
jgi:hypothetical protein